MSIKNAIKRYRDIGKALQKVKENAIIKRNKNKDFDLQLFTGLLPKERIYDNIKRQEAGDISHKSIKYFTKEAVQKAEIFYEENLKNGFDTPDGSFLEVTMTDFYHLIADPVILKYPELIKDIVQNASAKFRIDTATERYISTDSPGYVIIRNGKYRTAHAYGRSGKNRAEKEIQRLKEQGTTIIWEKS